MLHEEKREKKKENKNENQPASKNLTHRKNPIQIYVASL